MDMANADVQGGTPTPQNGVTGPDKSPLKDSLRSAAGSFSFPELARNRYSVRSFLDTPVDDRIVSQLLQVAGCAPSACNNQPWLFIVIRDPAGKARLEAVYSRPWFLRAPVIIAACYDTKLSWRRSDGKDLGEIDTAIAVDHLTLAAAEQGLGTCWVGAFNVKAARLALMLPDHIEPVAFIPLGYPASRQPKKSRKPLDQIMHREYYAAGGQS
jgi:nitroreductase